MRDEYRELVEAFGPVAGTYERARPGYPPALVDLLRSGAGLGPGTRAVDVGAGTGKLTRALAATGAEVVAVEPVAGMRAEFRRALPGFELRPGSAEALPLPDGCADVVAAGQAFHWFDPARALPEIHRVLRAGGTLVLVWNARDESRWPWDRVTPVLERFRRSAPRIAGSASQEAVAASPLFGPVLEARFRNDLTSTRAGFLDRVASTSFVAALDGADRAVLLEEIGEILDQTAAGDAVPLPYVTEVYRSRAEPHR